MKKIGILTRYYKNYNYGGLLQAYASDFFFNKNIKTEQIQYDMSAYRKSLSFFQKLKGLTLFQIFKKTKGKIIRKQVDFGLDFSLRIKKYLEFQLFIKHSQDKLLENNKKVFNEKYDAFIVGSDVIWNPKLYHEAYYLTFVSLLKLKIAYAASMGVCEISDEMADKIIPLIERFDYVSVREKSAKDLINRYTDKEVTVVSDPVLLLNQDDWNEVAVSPISDKSYVYTYLLGDRKVNRDITTKIAKDMKLPLVTVPYIHLRYNDYDKKFGDIQLDEVGPAEFVGLIRDSKMVVTDSFHAVVFSLIYNIKFVALKRNLDTETGSMNSRIIDLLEEMGLADRIVESIDEVTEEFVSKEIDFSNANKVIKEKKIISIEFLKKAFTDTELEEQFTEYLLKLKEES
ncbi:MAG: polysaccharide pyruvyl transferase family protein [Clostridia bacterium]